MIIDGERKLAYITSIQEILPIPNADKIELARVGGWQVVVKKDEFKVGDLVVYIEIDSRVPSDREEFAFLADRKYKVKSIKLRGQVSQGLIMPTSILPTGYYNEGDDVTKILGITKIEDETKEPIANDEKRLKQRHKKLVNNKYFKFMMKYEWFRKLAFKFLLPKKKAKGNWPFWIVKTDEERIQNMMWVLQNKEPFEVTEKLDGTSSTYSLHREKNKWNFYVCSRNVLQDTPDKKCFHNDMGVEGNVYWEMAQKYDLEAALRVIALKLDAQEYVTLQGETIGAGIQGNKYGLNDHQLFLFNLIIDGKKYSTTAAMEALREIGLEELEWVPLINTNYILPDTLDELMEFSTGKSVLADTLREGYVFRRTQDNLSFKCVSNEFLLKHKL